MTAKERTWALLDVLSRMGYVVIRNRDAAAELVEQALGAQVADAREPLLAALERATARLRRVDPVIAEEIAGVAHAYAPRRR